ncbi:MAG TPA: PqqD family protein [Gemmatimonadales bacterium]|nr:PqqD family protein [Gemmatimonadales bacterium]
MTLRYKRHPELRLSELEGEGVVLHLGTRRYFTLSESGLAMLEALAAPRSVDDLVQLLRGRYEVTAERAAEDVHEFLDRCREADLLVVDGEP